MKLLVDIKRRSFKKLFRDYFSLSIKPNNKMNFVIRNSTSSENSTEHIFILKSIQTYIPKLTSHLRKGQCGRVGVIGGSYEYTGAPYFAAISSLKLGVDIVHVFCCKEAGPAIKSYSPELIVHPFLDSEDAVRKIEPWLEKLHALIIGPGLGREKGVLKNVEDVITLSKEKLNLPLIIDADGLYLITENINLLNGYNGPVILTPNGIEFNRLCEKMSEKDPFKISTALNVILLQKGLVDVITNGIHNSVFNLNFDEVTIDCDVPGSNRRCGGQGDVLSGCIATFIAWLQIYFKNDKKFNFEDLNGKDKESFFNTYMYYSFAVYGACIVTRTCSRLAFEASGRGMIASDLISFINKAFQMHFGQ